MSLPIAPITRMNVGPDEGASTDDGRVNKREDKKWLCRHRQERGSTHTRQSDTISLFRHFSCFGDVFVSYFSTYKPLSRFTSELCR